MNLKIFIKLSTLDLEALLIFLIIQAGLIAYIFLLKKPSIIYQTVNSNQES